MNNFIKIWLFILFLSPTVSIASDYLYILDDKCILDLYQKSIKELKDERIKIVKDSRGLILRLEEVDITSNLENFNPNFYDSIKKVEFFLAKIENPAIIEVHTDNTPVALEFNLKNWELSTIFANKIEDIITKPKGSVEQSRVNSIGYGEFLPAKNTSNNGGKSTNRVDIIILCNISGE